MSQLYWEKALEEIDESKLQELLSDVYKYKGYQVKNMHTDDRRSENGADLVIVKGNEKILVAVKKNPKKGDIDQLNRLYNRKEEASLVYAYSGHSTGPFLEVENKLNNGIEFLTGKSLHDFLLMGESVDYLLLIFKFHPLVLELSNSLAIVWEHRKNMVPETLKKEDLKFLYSLKQAVLKKRISVGIVSWRYDYYANSHLNKKTTEFPSILDEQTRSLDQAQVYSGSSMFVAFKEVAARAPHLFAILWNIVSMRTNWREYTHKTESLPDLRSVVNYTVEYWLLPYKYAIGEAGKLDGNAIGFLSGLDNILRSLTYALREIDVAIDWVWVSCIDNFH